LVFVIEWCDANDWAKDFFAPAAIGFGNVQQNGRFEIKAFAGRTITAGREFASAFASISQVFFD
jgi:hypothetical protein